MIWAIAPQPITPTRKGAAIKRIFVSNFLALIIIIRYYLFKIYLNYLHVLNCLNNAFVLRLIVPVISFSC